MVSGSALDRVLVREYGSRSPVSIAEDLGVDVEVVVRRTRELLGERDYLGEEAVFGVILGQLREVVSFALGRVSSGDVSNRDVSGILNSATNALSKQLGVLKELQARSVLDVERVRGVYARELVGIVEEAERRLVERFGELLGEGFVGEQLELEVLEVAREVDGGR